MNLRQRDQFQLTSSKGNASVVDDPAHPNHLTVTAGGQTVSAVIVAKEEGFTARADDGHWLDFAKNGSRIDVHTHGFGQDGLGVFLQRQG